MSAVPRGYFVTGTDTGIGKTRVSLGLMARLQGLGLRVAGMKPVASGCEAGAEGLVNADADALRAQASIELPYQWVNPYAFAPAVAPHLAAEEAGVEISLARIDRCFRQLVAEVDAAVVEGVGGWLVPLNRRYTVADLAGVLGLPVILVVGIRLGCLNHALLTVADIERRKLPLAGWVANHLEPETAWAMGNVASLGERVAAPLLGRVPYLVAPQAAAIGGCLNLGWPV